MQQHYPSKFCDGLSAAHTCVRPIADGGASVQISCGTNLMQTSIQMSECFTMVAGVHCSSRPEVHNNNIFLFQKDCNHDPSSCWHPLHFFFGDNIWCNSIHCCLDLGSQWWSQVSFHNSLQKEALNLSAVLVQKVSGLPCPCEWIGQPSWQPTSTDLRVAKLFNTLYYIAFTNG